MHIETPSCLIQSHFTIMAGIVYLYKIRIQLLYVKYWDKGMNLGNFFDVKILGTLIKGSPSLNGNV